MGCAAYSYKSYKFRIQNSAIPVIEKNTILKQQEQYLNKW